MQKTFLCKTLSNTGRIITENLQADSRSELIKTYEQKGRLVLEIKAKSGFLDFLETLNPFKSKIRSSDISLFSKELSILIKAGIPLPASLSALSEHASNGKIREIIQDVRKDIDAGVTLSESMAKHPDAFPSFFVTSIKSGENTDNLVDVLEKLSEYYKIIQNIRRKVTSALIYPSFLLTLACFAIAYLLVFVVPVFARLYSEIGQDLPYLTIIIMKTSHVFRVVLPFLIPAVLVVWYILAKYFKEPVTIFLDSYKLKIPIFKNIIVKYSLSHFCKTLVMLLKSGVPLIRAVEVTAETIDNSLISAKIKSSVKTIKGGSSFANALKETGVFPPLLVEMVHTGEQTGALERMLEDASTIYDEDVNNLISSLFVMIEPVMMLIMGVLIALVLLSMYLPIFELSAKF